MGAAASMLIAGQYIMPLDYGRFLIALRQQTLGTGDIGYSIFGLSAAFMSYTGAIIAHVAIVAVLVCLVLVRFRRQCDGEIRTAQGMLLAALAILANPRMKEYDVFPLMFLAFSFVWIRDPKHALWIVVAGVLTAAVPLFVRDLQMRGWLISVPQLSTHASEPAGLIVIALASWRYARVGVRPPLTRVGQSSAAPHQVDCPW